LPEPYRLDSSRCISYWTIENRGDIPATVRSDFGEWVFGCDICQEVCPVNTNLEPADHGELQLPKSRAVLDLTGLLGIAREEYTEVFRRSAMKRAKLTGLRRNAAVAMGNSGASRYTEPLIGAVSDGEALVRRHAAWALGRLGTEKALMALRSALESEPDPEVKKEIWDALQVSG
jgi:epoxyqueuosine reductase